MSATEASAATKLAAYLARLSPVPAFTEYTGPYKVGTMDVEIPVDDLDSPSPAPDNAAGIETVQYRIFYPAVPESNERGISWLPAPQRHHVAAYTKFIGINHTLAGMLSYVAHLRHSLFCIPLLTCLPDSCQDTCTTLRYPSIRIPR